MLIVNFYQSLYQEGSEDLKNINTIANIKSEVEGNIGKKVILRADKGRKRIVVNEGFIEEVYPNLFTVRINNNYDNERTISYSYSDILTSSVELKFC